MGWVRHCRAHQCGTGVHCCAPLRTQIAKERALSGGAFVGFALHSSTGVQHSVLYWGALGLY